MCILKLKNAFVGEWTVQNFWNGAVFNRAFISSEFQHEDKSNLTDRTVWNHCLMLQLGMLNMASVCTVNNLMLLGHFLTVWKVISPCICREGIWGSEVKLHLFTALDGVNGQLHARAASSPAGIASGSHWIEVSWAPQRRFGWEKNLLSLPRIEPRSFGRPVCCVVTSLTESSWPQV